MTKPSALPVRANQAGTDQPKTDVELETIGDDIHISFAGQRRYRIRGLEKNNSCQQLKVNILAARDDLVHLDTLDLYKARSRTSFIKATAAELLTDSDVIKRDIGTMLLKLEQLQQDQIEAATELAKPIELTEAETKAALEFLRDPNLIEQILADYDACGLAGEEANKLVCYLACVSRRLKTPLALLIQSGSAAGKTTLMDAALDFVPEEDQIRYSAMTGQSLYYMGETNMKHKILAISEEEGVTQASYALKLLQSDGKLNIAAVGKNSVNGRQTTETHTVEGPVMMFLTTTSEKPDPELQNRCIVLRVNESTGQTAEIHSRQRTTYLRGKTNRLPAEIHSLHQNAQRLIEALPILMPWADRLTFRNDQTRMRDKRKGTQLIVLDDETDSGLMLTDREKLSWPSTNLPPTISA